MTTGILAGYMIVMAGVTYLVRMIPFTFFRKKIRSRFFRSFLYYVPYAVISAMTFPAIFYSTGSTLTALAGTVLAFVLAYLRLSLTVVAMSSAGLVLVISLLMQYLG